MACAWLIVVSCLPLVAACASPSSDATPLKQGVAAFFYTYFSQTGESGVAGARASDGADVWRAPIGHANWAPIIVGSTLYACVRKQGQDTQDIVSVRVSDGHVLWTTYLPSNGFNAVVNADGTIIAVDVGETGLYALDAASGAIRWHVAIQASGKPLLSAGVIVALVSHSPNDTPTMAAYRASDGKRVWQAPYGDFNGRFEASATRAFGYTTTHQLIALALRDGRLLWTGTQAGFPIALTPGGAVILANDQRLAAVSQQDGSSLWQSPTDPGIYVISYDTLPTVNDTLYLVNAAGLVAVRASDGAALWRFKYPLNQAESVIAVNGMIYLDGATAAPGSPFGGGGIEVCALTASDGSVIWRHTIQGAQLLAEPVAGS